VSDKVPELPARLDEVLNIGLRRDPAQRFATARDMALELEKAVVPALTSEVGTWVESVAGAALVARAAKVQEMEATSASKVAQAVPAAAAGGGALPGLVSTRDLYEEQAAVNLPKGARAIGASSSLMHPTADVDGLVPERAKDGSVRWKARSEPPPPRTQNVPPMGSPILASGSSGPSRTAVAKLAKSGAGPSADAAPHASTRPRKPRNRTVLWVAIGASLVALTLFAFGARTFVLPGYVRSSAIADAAVHGVTLTVNDATLSDDGVLLSGLTAKLVGVPQASATIATADVRVAWGTPMKVVLGKTEVLVDGDGRKTLAALDAWTATQRTRSHGGGGATNAMVAGDDGVGGQVEIPHAHLVWTHASSDVPRIEATGLQGTVGSPNVVTPTDDVHFLAAAVTVETRAGTFGPWSVDVDHTPKGMRARLAFDPAVPDGANALLVEGAFASDVSFDVTIPRLPITNLGVPRTALGAETTLPQQVELALHYGRSGRSMANATLRLALYGAHVPELGTNVDVHITGDASGPWISPLPVKNGLFSIGPVHGTVTGTVTPETQSAVASLAWKADPMPCSSLVALPTPGAAARDVTRQMGSNDPLDLGELARDFGAIGEAVGAVKVTGSFVVSGTVLADSANLSQAKFGLSAKNACGIALFQGK
jgi:hypothetical protein